MATTKVSELSALTTTDGAEELLINDGGTSKKVTIANLLHDNSIDSDHYVNASIDNAHLADDAVGIDELSATGSAGSSTFLRGDNSWVTPTDTNTMGSGFTVSATTDSNATTITQGDDLFFAAGTGITCATTADGTVTITNTVTDTNTTYAVGELTPAGTYSSSLQTLGNITASADIFLSTLTGHIYKRANDTKNIVRTTRTDDTQEGLFSTDGWGSFTFNRKLGIGLTTQPPQALTVAGNISSSGYIHTLSHITASGHISASGNIYSNILWVQDSFLNKTLLENIKRGFSSTDDSVADGGYPTGTARLTKINTEQITVGTATTIIDDNIYTEGHITASGNISSSGTGSFSDGRFTGKVGIGTTTPAYPLEVAGDIALSSWGQGLIFGNVNNYTRIQRPTSTNDLGLYTSNNPRIYINSSGKVGIGTTTPPEKLTVTGNISSSGAINTLSHITASGNISASGTISTNTIQPSAGSLIIKSSPITEIKGANDEYIARFIENGSVDLYYNNNLKFETTGDGVYAIGNVSASGTIIGNSLTLGGTAITSTAAELNILDGVTSTAAELNILDGVTSTAAELNIMDGVTSTAAELNILDGATVVVGEVNYNDLGGIGTGTAIASKTVVLDSTKTFTGANRSFKKTSTTDGNYEGDVVYFGATETVVGSIYHYVPDGEGGANWTLADADAESTSKGLLAVALGGASNTNGMLLRGMVTLNHDPGSITDTLFLSITAGQATATAPSGNTDIVRIIGYSLDSTNGQIWFDPDKTFVEVSA